MSTNFENLFERLAEFQAMARTLREQTAAAIHDQSVEGSDPAGVVTATVSADGALTSIVVDNKWADALDSSGERLGQAVVAASAAAHLERAGFAPIEVDTDQPQLSVDEIERRLAQTQPAQPEVLVSEADREAARTAVSEQVAELKHASATLTVEQAREKFLTQLDRLDEVTASLRQPSEVEYANETRTVVLVFLGAALTRCSINDRWAARQSGTAVTMALSEVLQQVPQPV